jgi:GxxExxY protein
MNERTLRQRSWEKTEGLIASLIEVHRHLGPGLLESVYEACLCHELRLRGHVVEAQRPLRLEYKGAPIDCAYRLDIVVDDELLIELKTVEKLLPIHSAQVITYLKLSGLAVGLLVNFNTRILTDGIKRLWLS